MTEYTPKDLAKFTYRVPDDMSIPAGTPYVYRNLHGYLAGPICQGFDVPPGDYWEPVRWVAEPIRRPLPTKPGSVITDVTDHNGDKWLYLMRDQNGRWSGVFHNGQWGYWDAPADSKIIDWTPGRIVPDDGSTND